MCSGLLPTSNGTRIFVSLENKLKKRSAHFNRSRKYLDPADVVSFFTRDRSDQEWCGNAQSSVSIRHEQRIRGLLNDQLVSILQSLSQRQNVASSSLLYRNYFCRCSDKLQSIVPSDHTFTVKTGHVMFTMENHLQYHVPLIKSKLYSDSLSFRTVTSRNKLPRECFFDYYNIWLFTFRVNRNLTCLHNNLLHSPFPSFII